MTKPHVDMNDPEGPWVEYDDGDDLGTVEGHVPGEWRADWTRAVRLPIGRWRAPLFHTTEVFIDPDPTIDFREERQQRERA